MKAAALAKLPRERTRTAGWRRRIMAPIATLWASAMRATRGASSSETRPIFRVTWDFGKAWKGWPW